MDEKLDRVLNENLELVSEFKNEIDKVSQKLTRIGWGLIMLILIVLLVTLRIYAN